MPSVHLYKLIASPRFLFFMYAERKIYFNTPRPSTTRRTTAVERCWEVKNENTYLGDTTNVLIAILLAETQVLVEAEAHVVAVEAVRGEAQVQQVLLEGGRDGGLARGGKAGEPDGHALLAAELIALLARERRVPCDVAVLRGRCVSFLLLAFATSRYWRGRLIDR